MPISAQKILVVGGAGFIGSHMVYELKQAGYIPIVLDNLSKGHRHTVYDAELIVSDAGNLQKLTEIFKHHSIDAVMHFASLIEVAESIANPIKYYRNNVAETLNLLDVMHQFKIDKFIFSSTAAVYGEPQITPIPETHPLQPINPYGKSKKIVEEVIRDFSKSYPLKFAILRYFNASGANPEANLGENHQPESHLIPKLLEVALGRKEALTIFGDDYATMDGTCIRDYIHVKDLCHAHLKALRYLEGGANEIICNLGGGCGYSNKEVIQIVEKVTQKSVNFQIGGRRTGDPAVLIADIKYAKQQLDWAPIHSEMEQIIADAFKYMLTN